jgi:hypothetical protein
MFNLESKAQLEVDPQLRLRKLPEAEDAGWLALRAVKSAQEE